MRMTPDVIGYINETTNDAYDVKTTKLSITKKLQPTTTSAVLCLWRVRVYSKHEQIHSCMWSGVLLWQSTHATYDCISTVHMWWRERESDGRWNANSEFTRDIVRWLAGRHSYLPLAKPTNRNSYKSATERVGRNNVQPKDRSLWISKEKK